MRTLKTFFIFFFIIVEFCSLYAQIQDQGLVVTDRPLVSASLQRDADIVTALFDITNTTSCDIILNYLEEKIEIEGSQSMPFSNLVLAQHVINSQQLDTVAQGYPYGKTIQDFFQAHGGVYIGFSLENPYILKAGATATFVLLAHTTNDATGRFRFVTSDIYGYSNSNQLIHLYQPIYHGWEGFVEYSPSSSSISLPTQRIVAPGTQNFSMDVWAQSPNSIEGIDAVLNYPGHNPLIYAVGSFMPSQYQNTGWTSDGNTTGNTTRIIAYGNSPQQYVDLGNQYFRLGTNTNTGDIIPLEFGMATMNDSIYPSFNDCQVIVGPHVMFGDANGDSNITVMDLVSMMQYMSSYTAEDTGTYLKTRLASDLDGNGWVDSYDLYLERQMLLQPYFTPPVADPYYFGSGTAMGKVATKTNDNPIISFKQTASGIEVYANIPITNGDLYISDNHLIENGSMQSFGSALKNGKTYIFFASDSAVSKKPLCIIKNTSMTNVTVTGFVNNHIPITISSITSVDQKKSLPKTFILSQNYPNPFNPTTEIQYSIPKNAFVNITIYNILGQEVSTLINKEKNAGTYTTTFDGSRLASGAYIYRLRVGTFVSTKKMVLMK